MEEEMSKNNAAGRSTTRWKLYDNPHYSSPCHDSSPTFSPHNHFSNCQLGLKSSLATVLRPMDFDGVPSKLELAQAQVRELKAELDMERRMRWRAESVGRTLARELAEERGARAAAKELCARLAEQVARGKEEAGQAGREVEQERRMFRGTESLRQERKQTKLADARLVMEENIQKVSTDLKPNQEENIYVAAEAPTTAGATCRSENTSSASSTSTTQQGQQKREVENPHIKRGIKGFVEFRRVVRVQPNYAASGAGKECQSQKNAASNNLVECQKAQLRILLRQRTPTSGFGLVGASENVVM